MTEPRSVRLGLATIAAVTSSAIAYALLRIVQVLRATEPNPALVLWSEHSGYFWRAWTAAYLGGMVAFVGWAAAGRAPDRTARVLGTAVVLAAVLIAAQGVLVP